MPVRLLRKSGINVSYGLYTGESDAASQKLSEEPAETERLTRVAIKRDAPDILLTNFKQLEFLLVRSEDRVLFTDALRYLVLDELHSYRGALATEIACLIRRLKAHARRAPGELVADRVVGRAREAGVARDDGAGGVASAREQVFIAFRIEKAEIRETVLLRAEEIAHAAQPQIGACYLEAIFTLLEDAQTLQRILAALPDEHGVALLGTSSHATAQLMQL